MERYGNSVALLGYYQSHVTALQSVNERKNMAVIRLRAGKCIEMCVSLSRSLPAISLNYAFISAAFSANHL